MTERDRLMEAFDTALAALENGANLEGALAATPARAAELRPLLLAALSAQGWLFGVVAHQVAQFWRTGQAVPDDRPDERAVTGEASARLRRSQVRTAWRQLTQEQQQILALRFGDGFSVEESATVMGKSVTAGKALQFRALATLRRHLGVGYG
jgi:DNA-directed RNA polymerase specialized sigma24 family protein